MSQPAPAVELSTLSSPEPPSTDSRQTASFETVKAISRGQSIEFGSFSPVASRQSSLSADMLLEGTSSGQQDLESVKDAADSSVQGSAKSSLDLAKALKKKEDECEHLRSVIQQLSSARARDVKEKAELREKYLELQTEYCKQLKVTELAITVSRQNMGNNAKARKELRDTQADLYKNQKLIGSSKEKTRALKAELASLKERVALLERLNMLNMTTSVCRQEFTYARHYELY